MSGYILVQRGLFEHDAFRTSAPLSDLEAWIWLIEHANWDTQRFRSGYTMIDIPRGALATHYRTLAKNWRWDHKKVIRFLKLLQNEAMIAIETPHRMVQITLCNYEKYQKPWDGDAPEKPQQNPSDAPRMGTKRIHGIQESTIDPLAPSLCKMPFTEIPLEWKQQAMAEKGWPEHVIADIWQNFREYWQNGRGKNTKREDWGATWRTWYRKENIKTGGTYVNHKSKLELAAEAVAAARAERERGEQVSP